MHMRLTDIRNKYVSETFPLNLNYRRQWDVSNSTFQQNMRMHSLVAHSAPLIVLSAKTGLAILADEGAGQNVQLGACI